MTLVLITAVLTIAALVFMSARFEEDKHGTEKLRFKLRKTTVLGLLPILLLGFGMVATVPVNSVGIVFNQFTGVQQEVRQEGIHVKSPFEKFYIIPTEIQSKELLGLTGQTKDAQWIQMDLDIKYRVSRTKAFEVFTRFRNLENVDNTLLSPIVQRSVESVTTQYNVIDILGEKRNEAYTLIEREVAARLAESGIEFISLVLTDTDAGSAIEQAIEQEAVAKKAVETALQVKARAEIDAQTKVMQASAAAEVAIIEAQAIADANMLMSNSITPEILRKMEMEARIKWGWITVSGAGGVIVQP